MLFPVSDRAQFLALLSISEVFCNIRLTTVFDRELMHTFGDAIGKEAQANDLSIVLGPAVNIKRSPLCGRNFEYYYEDPYLTGETASAFIDGVSLLVFQIVSNLKATTGHI